MDHTTITVGDEERALLRDASEELFGTRKVPYRTTIRKLVSVGTEIEVAVDE